MQLQLFTHYYESNFKFYEDINRKLVLVCYIDHKVKLQFKNKIKTKPWSAGQYLKDG